jgi:hypothetical protein
MSSSASTSRGGGLAAISSWGSSGALPAHGKWHQLQQSAAYRPPTKTKQGPKKEKAGKGEDAAGTEAAGEASAAMYEDGGPASTDAVRVVLQVRV